MSKPSAAGGFLIFLVFITVIGTIYLIIVAAQTSKNKKKKNCINYKPAWGMGDTECIGCTRRTKLVNGECKGFQKSCLIANCQICHIEDSSRCMTCKPGFSLTGEGKCKRNIPDDDTPEPRVCETIDNCSVCDSDPTECEECNPEYERDGAGGCRDTFNPGPQICNVKHCFDCVLGDPNLCDACDPGYEIKDKGETCELINGTEPEGCETINNCFVCDLDPTKCEECDQEFRLIGGRCVSRVLLPEQV